MEEKKLVPKLRFPGFTEPWEQRKLGEIVSAYSGGTPSASNKEYYGGDIPFIRSAEINNNHTELYITQKGLKDSSAKLVEKGTILYAMYGATSGEVSISQIDGAINQAILAMVPLMYDGEFIAQYLRRQKKNIINKYLQGGQGNLSANIVLNLQIQLPGVDEANQITSFFVKLDNLITIHQRKLEHLKLKKKSLLQKLFPKEGEVYPELRFPGFTAPWEQRKLGDMGKTFNGLAGKTKEDFGHGAAQYVTYLNVFQNTMSDLSMTEKIEIDKSQNEVQYGDILFTTSSETPEEVGMSSVWLGKMLNTYLNSFCFGYRPMVDIDHHFIGNLLRSSYVRNKMKILAQGISRYNISKNKVMDLEIALPSKEEQKLIGSVLNYTDNLITLHQRKLEHLQLLKKALLQQLFV